MVVRGTIRLIGWCLALAVTLTALHLLPVPAGAIDLASRDPADLLPVLLRGARWVALACAWYLTGATALSALTAVVAWRPLRRLDAALSIPVVRHVVRTGLGATLAVGLGFGPSAAAFAAPGPPGASGQPAPHRQDADLDPGGDHPAPPEHAELVLPEPRHVEEPDDPPELPAAHDHDERVGPGDDLRPPEAAAPDPGREVDTLPSRGARLPAQDGEPSDPAGPSVTRGSSSEDVEDAEDAEDDTHEVVAGESFWSIAAELTAAELDRVPDDAEVFERWIVLIEHNRDQLRVPDDPDLLLPGQRLRLPGSDR